MLVHGFFVGLGGERDKEVAGIHCEEGGQQVTIRDFVRVHGIAVPAGTGVDANVAAFGRREAGKDSVVARSILVMPSC